MSGPPNILGWGYNAKQGRHERMFGDLMGVVWDLGTGFWAAELSSPAGRLSRCTVSGPAAAARLVERAARERAAGGAGEASGGGGAGPRVRRANDRMD
jgi:hypothetical protein